MPSQQSSTLVSSEQIARWLEFPFEINGKKYDGFRRDIAGDIDFDNAVKAVCESINHRKGLYVVGECGSGKTHLLRKIQYDFIKTGASYRWNECSDSNERLWILDKEQNSEYRDEFNSHQFLDDLGVEVGTKYGRRVDFVCTFIRDYYERGTKSLFISSNLDMNALVNTYDARIIDRILDMCVVLKFSGKSKRGRSIIK